MVNEQVTPDSAQLDAATTIEVAIGPARTPGTFRVEVVRSPVGEAAPVVELDLDGLLARRPELQHALLASAIPARRLLPGTEQPFREVGQVLFTALQPRGDAERHVYSASCEPLVTAKMIALASSGIGSSAMVSLSITMPAAAARSRSSWTASRASCDVTAISSSSPPRAFQADDLADLGQIAAGAQPY